MSQNKVGPNSSQTRLKISAKQKSLKRKEEQMINILLHPKGQNI